DRVVRVERAPVTRLRGVEQLLGGLRLRRIVGGDGRQGREGGGNQQGRQDGAHSGPRGGWRPVECSRGAGVPEAPALAGERMCRMTSGTSAIANLILVSEPNHRSGAMGDPDPETTGQQLRKFQKELSAGTVSLVLLAVLQAAGEPTYGDQVAHRTARVGQGEPVAQSWAM